MYIIIHDGCIIYTDSLAAEKVLIGAAPQR